MKGDEERKILSKKKTPHEGGASFLEVLRGSFFLPRGLPSFCKRTVLVGLEEFLPEGFLEVLGKLGLTESELELLKRFVNPIHRFGFGLLNATGGDSLHAMRQRPEGQAPGGFTPGVQ